MHKLCTQEMHKLYKNYVYFVYKNKLYKIKIINGLYKKIRHT